MDYGPLANVKNIFIGKKYDFLVIIGGNMIVESLCRRNLFWANDSEILKNFKATPTRSYNANLAQA
jgi:hypothetical protein